MRIDIEGAYNTRDLGGIVTPFGTVPFGRLVRSGELSLVTDNGLRTLEGLPLTRVIDLRTDTEIAGSPDNIPQGVEYTQIKIISATTFGITYETASPQIIAQMLRAGFERMRARGESYGDHLAIMYRKFVNEPISREGYGKFLRLLAEKPLPGATLWHCSVGKDRCGTCAALLLWCLGASKQQIYDDYILTNQQLEGNKKFIADKVRDYVSAEELSLIEKMRSASFDYLDGFFAEIAQKYRTVESFLEACGVTQQHIELLRQNYLQ